MCQARSLIRTKVDKALKSEIKNNYNKIYQSLNLDHADAALFANGMFFDMDTTDVFTLFEHLREEQKVMEGLSHIGEWSDTRHSGAEYVLMSPT